MEAWDAFIRGLLSVAVDEKAGIEHDGHRGANSEPPVPVQIIATLKDPSEHPLGSR